MRTIVKPLTEKPRGKYRLMIGMHIDKDYTKPPVEVEQGNKVVTRRLSRTYRATPNRRPIVESEVDLVERHGEDKFNYITRADKLAAMRRKKAREKEEARLQEGESEFEEGEEEEYDNFGEGRILSDDEVEAQNDAVSEDEKQHLSEASRFDPSTLPNHGSNVITEEDVPPKKAKKGTAKKGNKRSVKRTKQ